MTAQDQSFVDLFRVDGAGEARRVLIPSDGNDYRGGGCLRVHVKLLDSANVQLKQTMITMIEYLKNDFQLFLLILLLNTRKRMKSHY